MFIVISNRGVADPMGMRLMGASSKDASKIGRFGTGWKYGLASAIRLCGEVEVYLGTRHVAVSSTQVDFRGQPHQEITIDGQPIGVTDQLGKDWEPWMVLREFISNAVDEGDARIDLCNSYLPAADRTAVVLAAGPFKEVIPHLTDYFQLHDVPDQVQTPLGRALPKEDPNEVRIYKKGVLVKRIKGERSAFDYELNDVAIGEDRLAGDVREAVWKFLDAAPLEVKLAVLNQQFEGHSWNWQEPSKSWLEAFGDKLVVSSADRDQPDSIVVHYNFVEVANRVGARTLKSDKAARDAKRETMPASHTARDACKKLAKKGIDVNPALVLMAKLEQDYLIEKGVLYLKKDLTAEQITDSLIIFACYADWDHEQHLKNLAALARRFGKL